MPAAAAEQTQRQMQVRGRHRGCGWNLAERELTKVLGCGRKLAVPELTTVVDLVRSLQPERGCGCGRHRGPERGRGCGRHCYRGRDWNLAVPEQKKVLGCGRKLAVPELTKAVAVDQELCFRLCTSSSSSSWLTEDRELRGRHRGRSWNLAVPEQTKVLGCGRKLAVPELTKVVDVVRSLQPELAKAVDQELRGPHPVLLHGAASKRRVADRFQISQMRVLSQQTKWSAHCRRHWGSPSHQMPILVLPVLVNMMRVPQVPSMYRSHPPAASADRIRHAEAES